MPSSEVLHASAVAIDGRAVLIEGPSGSGKSDLALRLIDRGAVLVSDDYTMLGVSNGVLIAAPPGTIAGRMEVRGLGIIEASHVASVPAALVVRLGEAVERLPMPGSTTLLQGVAVPDVAIFAFEPSAAIKVELALRRATEAS